MRKPLAGFAIGDVVNVDTYGMLENGEILDVEWDRYCQCYTYVVMTAFGSAVYNEDEIARDSN